MIWKKRQLALALLILLGGLSRGGDFAAPADGPVPFRRDRVPLDSTKMALISRELKTLAGGLPEDTPENRRGAAQMLALALALDPGNSPARALVRSLSRGSHQPIGSPEEDQFRKDIWQTLDWLQMPAAGPDARALAACLEDTLAISAPRDPRSLPLLRAGQKGAWAGWIPPVAAYRPAPEPTPEPDDGQPATDAPAVRLAKATIAVPLWTDAGEQALVRWVFAPRSLEMTASKSEDGEGRFQVSFGRSSERTGFEPLGLRIVAALKKSGVALPAGVIVEFGGKALRDSLEARRPEYPTAAAAVLASAALTGVAPDATVIGDLDAVGNLVLPSHFWEQLRSVKKGDGKRLVLPVAAAEYLPSMLALEHPEFFLENEVLLATDFKQLVELTFAKPPEPLAGVLASFAEIREKRGKESTGPYVANVFVRRRLEDLGQTAPFHASARMLAVQGAGKRPVFVTRPVLAAELRQAIEPVAWLASVSTDEFSEKDIPRIAPSYEEARKRVDALTRYADSPDKALLDGVKEMLVSVRALERASRSRNSSSSNYTLLATLAPLQRTFASSFKETSASLAGSLGETPRK